MGKNGRMSRVAGLACIIVNTIGAVVGFGGPATRPMTPQATTRAYVAALAGQDRDALRGLFLVRTAGERDVVEVLVDNELALAP